MYDKVDRLRFKRWIYDLRSLSQTTLSLLGYSKMEVGKLWHKQSIFVLHASDLQSWILLVGRQNKSLNSLVKNIRYDKVNGSSVDELCYSNKIPTAESSFLYPGSTGRGRNVTFLFRFLKKERACTCTMDIKGQIYKTLELYVLLTSEWC